MKKKQSTTDVREVHSTSRTYNRSGLEHDEKYISFFIRM